MVKFTVQYGKENSNGKTLSKKNTVNQPTIVFEGEPGKVYSLLMSDPDALEKSWLHWLLINIPGESYNIQEGQTVMSYGPPTPPSGIHRYIFTLYEQPAGSIMVAKPNERGNFNVRSFEQQYQLSPVVTRTVRVPAS